jgi:predicted transcriptional regulator
MVAAHELGPLEMKVLGLVGTAPQTVSAVRARLREAGDDLAYTTVMTVLTRLHAKGLVHRKRDGNRYEYRAAQRASGVSRDILAGVRRALFRESPAQPILALLEDEEISDDELRELRAAIEVKLRERRGR